jgi:multimeric flavodoxin WrbA
LTALLVLLILSFRKKGIHHHGGKGVKQMNIIVLNGSPKGELSVTIQYIRYLQKKFPQHVLKVFPIAQQIQKLERDTRAFGEIMDEIRGADAVLWAFPLYHFLVCGQYKRFIELIFERNQASSFTGKYTASVSTSIHFSDHTAHNYIHAICDDLKMNYLGAYSAEMYDLMKKEERKRWLFFAEHFFDAAAQKVTVDRAYPPLVFDDFHYRPGTPRASVDTGGKRILILVDEKKEPGNLWSMVQSFKENFRGNVDLLCLSDIDIKGGCLGCCRCGLDNVCTYQGKDGFIDFYNTRVKQADIIVFAGAIRDRYLSSCWKTYFDRSFFNTHIPTLLGKQICFLISGPLGQIPNLRQILSGYVETQQANLAAIVTDESRDSGKLDLLLKQLALQLVHYAAEGYANPVTFLGQGGRKIFRDEVWGKLRFVFQADHRYYKTHGLYDFPQKNHKMRRMNFIMTMLTKLPPFRKKFLKVIKEQMVKPLQIMVEKK